ncbi:hypothetical protein GBA65_14940 [Rubrobacter marinus]|uniref:Major capsid protein n=1 Tax=Rubrobacter marinus TaxID=2653852 RepID=A0A6G8PZF7_9ACTN|nr:hypothetical protein [Rubrobacter marinus]QIN79603.1 hypothetical protein GBA65_14940 [Rubrobacter marinus]
MPTYNEIQPADPILSNIVIQHKNNQAVNRQLAPVILVDDREGQFPKWGLEAFDLEEDTLRAPRTKANAVDFGYTMMPYDMEEHALDFEYEEKERQKYERMGERIGNAALFNMERDGVISTSDRLQLRREKRAGDRLRSNEVPGEVLGAAVRFDQAGTDIPAYARFARNQINRRSGMIMNTVLLPYEVDDIVLWSPSVKAFLGGDERKFVDIELIKRVFRVENVITASMKYNMGTHQAPEFADVWGKDVVFAYVNPAAPDQRTKYQQSLAYTFQYGRTNNEAATPAPVQGQDQSMPVTAWYDQNTETHIRRVKYEEKIRIVDPGCGYVFREAIS